MAGSATTPGYVLTGGRSTRMGKDKARVEVDGEPMALRVAAALRAAGLEPVMLVSKDPTHAELGLPVVPDDSELQHPLVGVVAALRHAAAMGRKRLVIAPCDLAWLQAGSVQALLAAGKSVVAEAEGRRHPLLAVLDVRLVDGLAAAAAAEDSVHAALSDLPGVELPAAVLVNVNRPGDLERG